MKTKINEMTTYINTTLVPYTKDNNVTANVKDEILMPLYAIIVECRRTINKQKIAQQKAKKAASGVSLPPVAIIRSEAARVAEATRGTEIVNVYLKYGITTDKSKIDAINRIKDDITNHNIVFQQYINMINNIKKLLKNNTATQQLDIIKEDILMQTNLIRLKIIELKKELDLLRTPKEKAAL